MKDDSFLKFLTKPWAFSIKTNHHSICNCKYDHVFISYFFAGNGFAIPTGKGSIVFNTQFQAKSDKVDMNSNKENVYTMNEDENSDNLFQWIMLWHLEMFFPLILYLMF